MKRFGIFCGRLGWVVPREDGFQFTPDQTYPFKSHPEAILFGLENFIHKAAGRFLEVRSMDVKGGK